MEFNKKYDRSEFINFLQHKFLPEDFIAETTYVDITRQTKYIRSVTKLGTCESLDLVVYEIRHDSLHDARVGLSKEAFRFLADEWESKALVLFIPKDNDANYRFSLITIELNETEEGKHQKIYSNPRRYSYYLGEGIACHTPNNYLKKLGSDKKTIIRVKDEKDLVERFSVEVLTKAFYQELSDWYAWAVKLVRFPNKLDDKNDDDKYNSEATIRLVTRLIFVWFLKQKHLIPNEFFDEDYIRENLIKDFAPNEGTGFLKDVKSIDSKYYKAILQNLFFAMLNSPITKEHETALSERHFRSESGDYDNNKLMRYESMFKNPQLFIDLANKTVPFLNGGLFDCLDDKDNDNYVDGFSDREVVKKSLVVPDYLFFGEEAGKNIDLSEWYGDKKKKKVSARGIIDILKRYNFTVEENTPFDQEVSLDPELLGKVFENLLASFNPETQTTARKQTGSFYTPRDIVQYMVDESLVAHLKRTVGEELESEYRKLISYVDEEISLNVEQKQKVIEAIYHCKVLDPACGSGAFPVGMLQQMVHIFSQLDPTNEQWKKMMLDQAVNESRNAFQAESKEEREERLLDIERSFDENLNNPDYARKLYLIENCIYGVDIQPIAIQISKLRFFISLVVDQKTNNDPTKNFGIRPLPNLEAKFVAANSLIPLAKQEANIGRTEEITTLETKLKEANHKIFSAKTVRTKRKWKDRLVELRTLMAEKLAYDGFLTTDAVNQMVSWDMFDQNSAASFFDADWMFGIKDGFDIVIGNPPYVLLQNTTVPKEQINVLTTYFYSAQYKVDLYHLFFELSINVLTKSGILCLITPINFTKNEHNDKLRELLIHKTKIKVLVRFYIPLFDNASVDNAITLAYKDDENDSSIQVIDVKDNYKYIHKKNSFYVQQMNIHAPYYYFEFGSISNNSKLLNKIENNPTLKQFASSYFGIQTFDRNKFVSSIKIDDSYKPVVDGTHVRRYKLLPNNEYVCFTKEAIKSGGNSEVYLKDRILVRQIGKYPEGTICPSGIYTLNTIYNIYLLNDRISLKYLLGLINSKVLQYYWIEKFSDSKETFPKIKKKPLESLPIVEASHQMQEKLMNLIDMEDEKNIDFLIYHLYNLSYDEVLIIDPETEISREEYEKE